MKKSELRYKEAIGKLKKQKVSSLIYGKFLLNISTIQSVPDIYQAIESGSENVSLLTLRAKSAGSRVASHKRKSTHLANKGAFVGGGFSLCTSAANLG